MNNTNEDKFGSEGVSCASGNDGGGMSIVAAIGAAFVGLSHLFSQSDEQNKMLEVKMELERSQEELQKSQEELQKSQEELQKSQEELQKSQEELQKSQVEHRISQVNELAALLEQRQDIYCSDFRFREYRLQLEDKIKNIVSKLQPQDFRSHVEDGIERIFREYNYCGSTLTYMMTGKPRNGGIMWQYLKQWRIMANKSDEAEGNKNMGSLNKSS